MNRSTPGLPVHHQLPEFTETHIHRVSDRCNFSITHSGPTSLTSSLLLEQPDRAHPRAFAPSALPIQSSLLQTAAQHTPSSLCTVKPALAMVLKVLTPSSNPLPLSLSQRFFALRGTRKTFCDSTQATLPREFCSSCLSQTSSRHL